MATTLCCCASAFDGALFRASRTVYSTSARDESSDGVGTADGLGEAEGDPAAPDPCPQPARTRASQTTLLFTRGYFTPSCTSRLPSPSPVRGRHYFLPPPGEEGIIFSLPLAGRGRGGEV